MKDCLQSNARFSVETILGEMQTMRLIYPLYSTLHRGLQRRLEERRKMFPSASEEAIAPSYPIAQKGIHGISIQEYKHSAARNELKTNTEQKTSDALSNVTCVHVFAHQISLCLATN